MSCVKIYVDGSSKGNPGKAGIGVLVCDNTGKPIKKISLYIGIATNNFAEYTAMIYALQEALISGYKTVTVFTDSELVTKQLSGEYAVKKNHLKLLNKQVEHLKNGFDKVDIVFVPREKNKRADVLANQAIEDVS